MLGRPVHAFVWVALVGIAAALPGAARGETAADSLLRSATRKLAESTAASRRSAVRDLEAAVRLAPSRSDILVLLGQTRVEAGAFAQGRAELARAAEIDPQNPGIELLLGQAWKWDWLCTLESASFSQAVHHLDRAAHLTEKRSEACLSLAALALVRGDAGTAQAAARLATEADPSRPEALLGLACASYWAGELARAESLFATTLPRLPAALRARFETQEFVRAADRGKGGAWRANDPDLTTAENEAQLHFFSRVAHALLLFRDRGRLRWDARADLFARYGTPASIVFNPPGTREYNYTRVIPNAYAPDPNSYPYNEQIWSWPNLGIQADLWDMTLTQNYRFAVDIGQDSDPTPRPSAIADHPELVMLGKGRGVFRTMPPSTRAMLARGHLARFPIEGGSRLIGHVEVASGRDSLSGAWAVADRATGAVLVRGTGSLVPSACDPDGLRLAEFQADVPPGDYRVDFSVSGPDRSRGLAHVETTVAPPAAGLGLSDVVPLCSAATPGATSIRFEPDLRARSSASGFFSVYFEIRGLVAGADDSSHFSTRYSVRRMASERRSEPLIEASREEAQIGPLRRQFLNVPVGALSPGGYELEIRVRDLRSGREVRSSTRFVRERA